MKILCAVCLFETVKINPYRYRLPTNWVIYFWNSFWNRVVKFELNLKTFSIRREKEKREGRRNNQDFRISKDMSEFVRVCIEDRYVADHGVESGGRGWQIGRIRYCIAVCFRGRRMCRWPTFLTTRWISQHGLLAETRKRGHCATVLLLFIQTRGLAALHKSIYLSGAKRL